MSLLEPRFVEFLRMPLKKLADAGTLIPKPLVVVNCEDLLKTCLPLIDIQQQSKTNPNGVTTLLVSPLGPGEPVSDLSKVTLLDSREIITVFFHFMRKLNTRDTESIITKFLKLTMGEIVEQAPKIETLKVVDINCNLATVIGEFGFNSRIVVSEKLGDGSVLRFVFTVKDFLKLLEKEDLFKLFGDKAHNPNELNSTPLICFGTTLRKPVSLITGDHNHLLCVLKDENVISALSKMVQTQHRGLPVLGDTIN